MYGIEDPSALLRPWQSLQQFTEELYAMLKWGGKPEENPQQRRQKPAEQPISPSRERLTDEPVTQANTTRAARLEAAQAAAQPPPAATRRQDAERRPTPQAAPEEPRRQPQARAEPSPSRAVEFPSSPAPRTAEPKLGVRNAQAFSPSGGSSSRPAPEPRRSQAALPEKRARILDSARKPEFSPVPKQVKVPFGDTPNMVGTGGSPPPLIGIITSVDSEGVHVQTYSNGPDQAPDDGEIVVNIIGLAENAMFPANYWLSDIQTWQDGNGNTLFYAFPPLWVA